MKFKLDTITFLQAMCCLLPCTSNPIHLEGGRRWEGSPGTVAVMSRLVVLIVLEVFMGVGTWVMCESGVSPWSIICGSGCSGAGLWGGWEDAVSSLLSEPPCLMPH